MSSPGQIQYSIVIDDRSVTVSLNNLRNNLRTTFATQPGATAMNQQFNALRTSLDQTTAKSQTFNQAVKQWDPTFKTSTSSLSAVGNALKTTTTGLDTNNLVVGKTLTNYGKLNTTTTSVGSKIKDLGSRFSGMAVGLSATTSSVIQLQSGFRDYNDAQISVDRTTRKLSTSHEAVIKAQGILNGLVAKGITSGKDYDAALLNLHQAEQAEAIQKKQLIEANQALGDSQTNFALSILPTVTGAIGTLGFAFKDLNLNMKSLTGMKSALAGLFSGIAGQFSQTTSASEGLAGGFGKIKTALAAGGIAIGIGLVTAAALEFAKAGDKLFSTFSNVNAKNLQGGLIGGLVNPNTAKELKVVTSEVEAYEKAGVSLSDVISDILFHTTNVNTKLKEHGLIIKETGKITNVSVEQTARLNTEIGSYSDVLRLVAKDSGVTDAAFNKMLGTMTNSQQDVALLRFEFVELTTSLNTLGLQHTKTAKESASGIANTFANMKAVIGVIGQAKLENAGMLEIGEKVTGMMFEQGPGFAAAAASIKKYNDEAKKTAAINILGSKDPQGVQTYLQMLNNGFRDASVIIPDAMGKSSFAVARFDESVKKNHQALFDQAVAVGATDEELAKFEDTTGLTTEQINAQTPGLTALINKYHAFTPAQKEAGLGMDRMRDSTLATHQSLVTMAAGMGVSDDALLKFNVTAKTSTADVQKMNDKLLNLVLGHEQLIKVLNDTARATANANTGYIAANQKILTLIDSLEQKKAADQFELASLKLIAEKYGITLPAGIQATIENLTQLITEYKLTGSTAKATADLIDVAFAELHSITNELIQAAVKGGKDWKEAWKDLDKSFIPKHQKDDIKDLVQGMGKLGKAIDSATTASALLQLQLESGDLSRKDIKEWSKQLGENLGKIEKAGKKAGLNITTLTDPLQELLKTDPSASTLEKVNLFIEHLNAEMKKGLTPSSVKALSLEVKGLVEGAKGGTEGAKGIDDLTAALNKLTPAMKAAGAAWTGGVANISSATWSNPSSMIPPTPSKTPAAQTLPAPVIPAPNQTAVNIAFNQILENYKILVGKIQGLVAVITVNPTAAITGIDTVVKRITGMASIITGLKPTLTVNPTPAITGIDSVVKRGTDMAGIINGLKPVIPMDNKNAVKLIDNVVKRGTDMAGIINKLKPKIPMDNKDAITKIDNVVKRGTDMAGIINKLKPVIHVDNSDALSKIKAVISELGKVKDKSVKITTTHVTVNKTVSGDTNAGSNVGGDIDTTASFPTVRTNKVMTTNNADRNVSGGRGGTQMIELTVPVHIGDQELVRKIRKNLGNNFAKFS